MGHSLLQKILGSIAGILSFVYLVFMYRFPVPSVFFSLFIFWIITIALIFVIIRQITPIRWLSFALAVLSIFSFTGLISLVEANTLRLFLTILLSVVLALLLGWSMREEDASTVYQKIFRRFVVMLIVFIAYASVTTIIGTKIFFPEIPTAVISLASALVYGGLAVLSWHLYYRTPVLQYAFWFSIIVILLFELLFILAIFPFGYLVQGLLVTWLWYVIQLFIRFHLAPQGIMWKQQVPFLATNILLYIGVLFFIVRWI